MDLTTALEVKRELTAMFAVRGSSRRRFALGVAIPAEGAEYRIAVRAASEEDLPPAALDAIQRRTADLDVRYVGTISPSAAHALAVGRGAAIGASVGHGLCAAGTLGFFARRVADDAIGFVSNNHVLAAEDRGQDRDEILYPAPADQGRRTPTVIGHLAGDYPRLKAGNVMLVDCAFAHLVRGTPYDASSLGDGRKIDVTPTLPYLEPDVCKIGRTTGFTTGRITAFDLDFEIRYSLDPVRFKSQIEIDSVSSESPFSRSGDSGSLVFSRSSGRPVALVFARSAGGGYANCGLTYANPIGAVLDALGITFLT